MTDQFDDFEQDLHKGDLVYGDHDQITESLNALAYVVGCFGQTHHKSLIKAINDAVPILAEVDARCEAGEDVFDVADEYFGTPEAEARTVDAMAEGVKVAQRWLRDWMAEHGLEVISVIVPKVDGGLTKFNFGSMAAQRREFPGIENRDITIGATTPMIDPPMSDNPEHPNYLDPRGYL